MQLWLVGLARDVEADWWVRAVVNLKNQRSRSVYLGFAALAFIGGDMRWSDYRHDRRR